MESNEPACEARPRTRMSQDGPSLARAIERLNGILEGEGDFEAARRQYRLLVDNFPSSVRQRTRLASHVVAY